MNLENQILDMYDDAFLESTLSKIASEIPENLKNKELLSFEERNNYMDDDFALCIKTKTGSFLRKFPLRTDVDTAISSKYLELNAHKLDFDALKTAAINIKTACNKFNLEYSDFYKNPSFNTDRPYFHENYYQEKFVKQANYIDNKKSNSEENELNYKALNNRYSLKNLECIKKAEDYFEKYASEFTPNEKYTFSKNVIKRASDFGYDIQSKQIRKYAGVYGFNSNLVAQLNYRSSLTSSSNCQQEYVNLIQKIGSIQPNQFAEELGKIDTISGLKKLYGTSIYDNFATTFSSEKLAENNSNSLIDYKTIFQGIKKEKLISHFGTDFVKDYELHPIELYESLSDDAKEIIHLIDSGKI